MGRTTATVSIDEVCLHLAGATAVDARRLAVAFGEPERSCDAPKGPGWRRQPLTALRRAGLAPSLARRLDELRDGREAAAELDRTQRADVRLVPHRDPSWPEALEHLPRPPVLLAVRGSWPPPEPALAVVGARAATAYGRAATLRLAKTASRAGLAIVSGLARGVDRYALESAFDEAGRPVAVLGCGLGIVYPPEHHALQARIAREGTLVSEFPLRQPPTRWAFPRRNRIIAALARAVLVVEAGARSGALITAAHALELGRDVLAVPGPIDGPQSEGTNRLIADGAAPVLDGAGLLELLGHGSTPTDEGAAPAGAAGTLHPLIAALERKALGVDELATLCGLAVPRVRAELVALELEGRVTPLPGGRWEKRRR